MNPFHKTLMGMFLFWFVVVIVNLGVLAVAVWLVVYILRAMGVL